MRNEREFLVWVCCVVVGGTTGWALGTIFPAPDVIYRLVAALV